MIGWIKYMFKQQLEGGLQVCEVVPQMVLGLPFNLLGLLLSIRDCKDGDDKEFSDVDQINSGRGRK